MSQAKGGIDASKLKLGWEPERTERLLERVHARIRRRKLALRGVIAGASIVSVALLIVFGARLRSAPANVANTIVDGEHPIALRDGSQITIDPANSQVTLLEESASLVRVEQVRGSGRYAVAPNANRTFEVRAGTVTVTVVGTEFVVEERPNGAWVEVLRGKVRVSWNGGEAFVVAGESGLFPRADAPESPPSEASEPDLQGTRGPQATQMYRARVARHDYRGAYAVLSRHPALAGDTVEELLVAADVARLSDHPAEALPFLQRIVRDHPRDERAPLAAFTLGRTLGGLGRTEEAMAMFGRVRTNWPSSSLAEDALVRQTETASKIGDTATLRRLAEEYDRDYPNGRRRSQVRRYAHLE